MKFNRRQLFRTATGALAYASSASLLKTARLHAEEPIRVGNILDKTGVLNIYSLKQIVGVAMDGAGAGFAGVEAGVGTRPATVRAFSAALNASSVASGGRLGCSW